MKSKNSNMSVKEFINSVINDLQSPDIQILYKASYQGSELTDLLCGLRCNVQDSSIKTLAYTNSDKDYFSKQLGKLLNKSDIPVEGLNYAAYFYSNTITPKDIPLVESLMLK